MRDLLPGLASWRAAGVRAGIARVVDVQGSAPLGPGETAMAVGEDGEVLGAVSGGCIEAAAVLELQALLRGERAPGLVSFGYSDDDAFAIGLTCGGTIHLYLELLDWPTVDALGTAVAAGRPVALATVVASDDAGVPVGATLRVPGEGAHVGALGREKLDRAVASDALAALAAGRSGVRRYDGEGRAAAAEPPSVSVFVESFAPPSQMWIFGAVDFAAALTRVAKLLGYRVVVCDARPLFATGRRFPMADEVVVSWPDALFAARGAGLTSRDAVCVLTHDAKFDVPAIVGALGTDVAYLGVMGSRRTHAARLERLAAAGVTEPADLARLRSPIGLDLGGRTPAETAVSICAEIIALRNDRDARPLREGAGPIHARAAGAVA